MNVCGVVDHSTLLRVRDFHSNVGVGFEMKLSSVKDAVQRICTDWPVRITLSLIVVSSPEIKIYVYKYEH